MSKIAVIGAGIAGLTAASELQAAGHAVTLFEKSRGPGGRCATRRSAAGPFDHGVPGFRAATPAFRAQVLSWLDAGWVALDGATDESIAPPATALRVFGVPSMNTLAQQLAAHLPAGVELRSDTPVAAIEPAGSAATDTPGRRGWRLRFPDGQLDPVRFDATVVAVPAEQAAVLLGPDADMADAMRKTRSDPCWTVMAAWSDPLQTLTEDHRNIDPIGALSMALRDDARVGRPVMAGIDSRWVLHASAEWSARHLEANAADVTTELLSAFARVCDGDPVAPTHVAAHRWRYAQVGAPRTERFGWNAALRLGTCGDAWHGAGEPAAQRADGVERAWLSARAIAREMAQVLHLDRDDR